jgi:hypothetical protein
MRPVTGGVKPRAAATAVSEDDTGRDRESFEMAADRVVKGNVEGGGYFQGIECREPKTAEREKKIEKERCGKDAKEISRNPGPAIPE